jgi:hypothetical protein
MSTFAAEMPTRARIVKKETATTAHTTFQRCRLEASGAAGLAGGRRGTIARSWLAIGFMLRGFMDIFISVQTAKNRDVPIATDEDCTQVNSNPVTREIS